jgi:hypothetical protein
MFGAISMVTSFTLFLEHMGGFPRKSMISSAFVLPIVANVVPFLPLFQAIKKSNILSDRDEEYQVKLPYKYESNDLDQVFTSCEELQRNLEQD